VTEDYNPSYSEGEDGEDQSSKSARAKISRDPISTNKKLDMVVCTCHPSYVGIVNRRITVQAGLCINARPYLKSNQMKMGWVVIQVVEPRVKP
jgi:hypothetical protein